MKKVFALLVLFIAMACQNQQQELEEQKSEVLEVHDRTMEKRGKLIQTKSELDSYMTVAEDSASNLYSAINGLQMADEAMMNWMRNFESPDEKGGTDAEKIEYLKEEKKKIKEIEEQTQKALEKAEKVASNYAQRAGEAEEQ